MCCADGMGELMRCVGRVRADGEAARADDGEDEERVEQAVEAVDADCVAGLEAGGVEAGDQASDGGEGGAVRVVDRGVRGVDEDGAVGVVGGRVEGEGEDVFVGDRIGAGRGERHYDDGLKEELEFGMDDCSCSVKELKYFLFRAL